MYEMSSSRLHGQFKQAREIEVNAGWRRGEWRKEKVSTRWVEHREMRSPERRANRVWEPAGERINVIVARGVDVMVSPKRDEGGMPIPAGE
jgi:hypothetical protein